MCSRSKTPWQWTIFFPAARSFARDMASSSSPFILFPVVSISISVGDQGAENSIFQSQSQFYFRLQAGGLAPQLKGLKLAGSHAGNFLADGQRYGRPRTGRVEHVQGPAR